MLVNIKYLRSFLVATGLSSIIAFSASAQEGGGSALEEIVVTAQYREENLQDVPIAVTAFNAEMIRDADLHSLEDIATRVPSLTFSPFAPGQAIIALRGVSSNDDGAGTDNSVAVFLDEVYIGGLAAVAFDIFDVETVEVLRGPQGTLFGKNAIGGVINVRSKKPNTEEVTGRVELTAGNYQQFDARGFVSGPLNDNWAGKVTVSSRQNEGYVDNIFLNKKQKDQNLQSLRGQLLYHKDDIEALFSVEITKDDTEDMGRIPVTGISAAFDAMGGNRDNTLSPFDGDSNRESTQVSLKLSKQFDSGELISITGWRDFESRWNMDSVGVPFAAGPTADVAINDDIDELVDAVSQEFRWVSNLDGAVNYVAGLFFLKEDTHRIETFHMGGTAGGVFTSLIGQDISNQDNETTSYAAYGQLTWDASERMRLNVGGRFTMEEKSMDNISVEGGFPGIIGQDLTASISDDWTNFSPKVSLDYQLTESVLGYASIAMGFKSGGFPAAPSRIQDFQTIEPEEATSYEIGVKADVLDDKLRINATAYFMDYTDLQIQRFGVDPGAPPGSFGAFQTLNAGDAEVSGLEVEATWLITENLSLVGSMSSTDSEFVNTVLLDGQGNSVDISGQELTRAADSKYAVSLEYYWPLEQGGALRFRADQRYTSFNRQDIFADSSNQPGFHVVDARASWLSASEDWEVAVWSKNLRDEEYISHAYIVGPGVIATFGDPRTYGVTVTRSF